MPRLVEGLDDVFIVKFMMTLLTVYVARLRRVMNFRFCSFCLIKHERERGDTKEH